MKIYRLDGKPIALARPRLTRYQVYDSQKGVKLLAGITLQKQHQGKPLQGNLCISLRFVFKKPKCKKKSLTIGNCDLDNLVKFILDVANGILYHDDIQICQISALKEYGDTAYTEFTIYEITP